MEPSVGNDSSSSSSSRQKNQRGRSRFVPPRYRASTGRPEDFFDSAHPSRGRRSNLPQNPDDLNSEVITTTTTTTTTTRHLSPNSPAVREDSSNLDEHFRQHQTQHHGGRGRSQKQQRNFQPRGRATEAKSVSLSASSAPFVPSAPSISKPITYYTAPPPSSSSVPSSSSSSSPSNAVSSASSESSSSSLVAKADTQGHSQLSAHIIERLNTDTYECMICTDTIRRQVAVWSCSNCYALFHLYCIKQWRQSGEGSTTVDANKAWRCPGCQYISTQKPQPFCYCGKVVDPPFDPYILPHSCGSVCGKRRLGSDCPHACSLVCHPGTCPPCAALAPIRTCFCGKLSYRMRCGEKDPGRSCGEQCERTLTCGRHICDQPCHPGECPPCTQTVLQKCYCGGVEEKRPCGSGKVDMSAGEKRWFSCKKVCDHLLACGNHKCEEICHAGPCAPCSSLPERVVSCPCGKIPLPLLNPQPRSSCLDEIATCPNVCEKQLPLCNHRCEEKCHLGPCPPCKKMVSVKCRCGASSAQAPCCQATANSFSPSSATSSLSAGTTSGANELTCNKVCKALRNCGRHECRNRCCPSSPQADPYRSDPSGAHICSIPCDRKLKCGNHKCDLLCHPGKCPPCHVARHEPYVCECGKTKVEPPIMCGTPLPTCPHPCARGRTCGHRDGHTCHSRDSPCPPCPALVERMCAGGHETRKNIPCSRSEVTCGRTCMKLLACGFHQCKRPCHSGPCLKQSAPSSSLLASVSASASSSSSSSISSTSGTDSSLSCGGLCGRTRVCGHPCQATCHPDSACPSIPCKHLVKIFCSCKRRSQDVECLRGGPQDHLEAAEGETAVVRELLCDEQCALLERNRALALAFGKTVPGAASSSSSSSSSSTTSSSSAQAQYSDLLVHLARASPLFIKRVEHAFEELLKNPITNKYSFKPMDRLQRRIIHELAEHYCFDSQSFDQEPQRNVQIIRRRESRVPTPLLSEYVNSLPQNSTGAKGNINSGMSWSAAAGSSSSSSSATGSGSYSKPEKEQKSYVLHISDLNAGVKTHHLMGALRAFEGQFTLRWMDDYNALIFFRDRNVMRSVQYLLTGPGLTVQLYHDKVDDNFTAPTYSSSSSASSSFSSSSQQRYASSHVAPDTSMDAHVARELATKWEVNPWGDDDEELDFSWSTTNAPSSSSRNFTVLGHVSKKTPPSSSSSSSSKDRAAPRSFAENSFFAPLQEESEPAMPDRAPKTVTPSQPSGAWAHRLSSSPPAQSASSSSPPYSSSSVNKKKWADEPSDE